ncbi:MAG: Thioredoxin [Verrucomicrobia bacterium]|nr:Thioredoxin [Verrucomicrobiota bacterium]
MIPVKFVFRAVIGALLSVAMGQAAAPAVLTLNDLANHPDRWPASVTVQREFKFNGGLTVRKGQSVQVLEVKGASVAVDAGHDLTFEVKAAETDLLQAANQAWSKLAPEQREVDLQALLKDASLWPLKVKSTAGFTLANGTDLPPGGEYEFVTCAPDGVTLYSSRHKTMLQADLGVTDTIARARELAMMPREQRPARIPLALKGKLVDASGQATTMDNLEDGQVFALYYGASWCGPCRAFSPGLVKFIREAAPKNPRLVVVLMSNDKKDSDLFGYMKQESMPWPAVTLSTLENIPALMAYARGGIPQLAIVDRYGKLISEAYQGQTYVGPKVPLQALKKLLDSGAAK